MVKLFIRLVLLVKGLELVARHAGKEGEAEACAVRVFVWEQETSQRLLDGRYEMGTPTHNGFSSAIS